MIFNLFSNIEINTKYHNDGRFGIKPIKKW